MDELDDFLLLRGAWNDQRRRLQVLACKSSPRASRPAAVFSEPLVS
jgi:hypothetical protein